MIMIIIRKIFLPYALLMVVMANSQSPSLSVKIQMDNESTSFLNYMIEMKICTPAKTTKKGNWFSHDTSKINFTALKEEEVDCNNYLKNGEGIEVLSGDKQFEDYNIYEYHNQVFAWEKILVFRISDQSSAAYSPYMYIILPVRYKSFVTSIALSGIIFQPGKVIFLDNLKTEYEENALYIQKNLKHINGVDVKNLTVLQFLAN